MALYYVSQNNDFENRPFDTQAFWNRVADAADINVTKAPRRNYVQYAGIAAAIVIAVFGVKYSSEIIPAKQTPVLNKSYATTTAQRATILLSDGTRVTLAPQTRVQYSNDYGVERRDIHLDGEAYFEVAAQSNKPMVIFTGNTTTQVLGTSFSVRKYNNDQKVSVVVTSGKVSFTGAGVLKRGDAAEFSEKGVANVRHDVDVDAHVSWRNGRLAFNNATVSDVLPDLERWYGLKLRLASAELANRHITAAFEHETQSQVVSALATLLGARAERQGDVVTFIELER